MAIEIKQQLKQIKLSNGRVNPDRVWVAQTRENILNQIHNTVGEKEGSFSFRKTIEQAVCLFVPQQMVRLARPVAAFLLIGVITMSGWIASVNATQSCLPGEGCYNVKLAVEKTQVLVAAMTSSEGTQTQLHLEFATRRAQEAKKVVSKKDADSPKKATVAIKHLQDSLKSADVTVQNAGNSAPVKAAELAKDVNEKTEKIVETLKEVSKEVSKEPQTVDPGLVKQVAESTKMANETGIKAIEVAVQKQSETKDGVLKAEKAEEVKNLMEEKINHILKEGETVKAVAQDVLMASSSPAMVNPGMQVASSTANSSSTISVKAVVEQAVQKVNETTAAAEKVAAEAKGLAANNQLLEAVQKVRATNEIVNQAQQAVAEATQTVKDALPQATASSSLPIAPTTTTTTTQAVQQPAAVISTTSVEKK